MSEWTNQAERNINNARESTASRSVVCFEVLDYDSLTRIAVGDAFASVVGAIYKKVTIVHDQHRKYTLSFNNPAETNIKDTHLESRPLWELDATPATDEYDYSGSRTVNYILCLAVGSQLFKVDLGTLIVAAAGSYNLSGPDLDLKEDAGVLSEAGPTFTVTGDRIYGASVNCGLQALTYSFDVESMTPGMSFSNNVMFQYDSPLNAEDYNDYWTKKHRIVGALNYLGEGDSKQFACEAFPDTVLAVGYGTMKRR